jgi:hypothetical protein
LVSRFKKIPGMIVNFHLPEDLLRTMIPCGMKEKNIQDFYDGSPG